MAKAARKKTFSKSKLVVEPVVEAPLVPVEVETTVSDALTNTPAQLNTSIVMETKEKSVAETVLPAEEKTDKLSFLTDKPIEEEKIVADPPPKKPLPIIVLVLLAFLLGVLAGGFIIYKKGDIFAGKISGKKETVVEKQEQVAPSPAPTEEPVDLSKYTIEVLNGSGTAGAAGKLKETFVKEGFDVSSTGNATNSSFAKTVIRVKKEVDKGYANKLEDFLSKSYLLPEIQELEDSKKTDVVVIIGAE